MENESHYIAQMEDRGSCGSISYIFVQIPSFTKKYYIRLLTGIRNKIIQYPSYPYFYYMWAREDIDQLRLAVSNSNNAPRKCRKPHRTNFYLRIAAE